MSVFLRAVSVCQSAQGLPVQRDSINSTVFSQILEILEILENENENGHGKVMEYEKMVKRNFVIRLLPMLPLNSYQICEFFLWT